MMKERIKVEVGQAINPLRIDEALVPYADFDRYRIELNGPQKRTLCLKETMACFVQGQKEISRDCIVGGKLIGHLPRRRGNILLGEIKDIAQDLKKTKVTDLVVHFYWPGYAAAAFSHAKRKV